MSQGRAILGWPWRWLSESFSPTRFQVVDAIAPVVDVGSHNPDLRPFRQTFEMAAGTNTIYLPGVSRVAQLNGAAPVISTRGARRWHSLGIQSDTTFASGDNVTLNWSLNAVSHSLWKFDASGGFPSGFTLPLVRSTVLVGTTTRLLVSGIPMSVWVGDPSSLRVVIQGQAGTEEITISGIFSEAENQAQPLPDMFA